MTGFIESWGRGYFTIKSIFGTLLTHPTCGEAVGAIVAPVPVARIEVQTLSRDGRVSFIPDKNE